MQIGSYICVEIGDKSIENKKNPQDISSYLLP